MFDAALPPAARSAPQSNAGSRALYEACSYVDAEDQCAKVL